MDAQIDLFFKNSGNSKQSKAWQWDGFPYQSDLSYRTGPAARAARGLFG